MYKELLRIILRYRMALNPLIRYNASCIIKSTIVNELKRDIPIVVSMTSKEDDFDELELSLYSVFNQDIRPDRVVLWLSKEYDLPELPYSITRYVKNGLDIRFVEDAASFTNIIYALKEFRDSVIVTAEDGFYYPRSWLKKLYHSYISCPKDIHVNKAIQVKTDGKIIMPSVKWKKYADKEEASFANFPLTEGGVLYPPNCFAREVFRDDIYRRKTDSEWQAWAWCMALVSNRKIRVIKNHARILVTLNIVKQIKKALNFEKDASNIDSQILRLTEYYGQNIKQKLNI